VMRSFFEHVTAAAAFRTTNKAGAVLVLGMALGVAVGAAALARRRPGQQVLVGGLVMGLLLVVGGWPAFTGGLYSDQLTIPAYVLLSLPASAPPLNIGGLGVQSRSVTVFTAPGLDLATLAYGESYNLSLKYQ